jgi:hypothetical protein
MAHAPNVEELVQKAVAAAKEGFKENLRVLQFHAWERGYQACREGKQQFRNPYRQASPDDEALDRKNLG